ncbi:MAG: radical SAM protein [Spirochaetaceae bacterium]
MGLTEIKVKKAFSKSYFAGSMFGNMYAFSPYMGCSHDCSYCDGRAEKYHLEGDFSKDIKARVNIPDLLHEALPKVRENAPFHLSSGISDIYQEAEKHYNLTGRCSELFTEYGFHVSVLTKSKLVLRDLDNWKKVNQKGGFTLQMSINTLDETTRSNMEPNASTVEERLETVKIFKDEGCNVGIYMQPLLPGISDDYKGIEKLITTLMDLKVDYIMPFPVTLRPGRQKEFYLNTIEKYYPEKLQLYNKLYRDQKQSGMPINSYTEGFFNSISPLLKDINTLPPHYYYRGTMPLYCEIIILLEHMIQLYSWRGMETVRLEKAYKKLKIYLTDEKKNFNRKKSLPTTDIDDKLKFLILTNGLEDILQNSKLNIFIKQVVIDRKIFNYQTLKLN